MNSIQSSQQLRVMADVIVSLLTNIHVTQQPMVARLASAIVNLLSIQDSVNTDMWATLQSERRHRASIVARVAALESTRQRVACHDSQSQGESQHQDGGVSAVVDTFSQVEARVNTHSGRLANMNDQNQAAPQKEDSSSSSSAAALQQQQQPQQKQQPDKTINFSSPMKGTNKVAATNCEVNNNNITREGNAKVKDAIEIQPCDTSIRQGKETDALVTAPARSKRIAAASFKVASRDEQAVMAGVTPRRKRRRKASDVLPTLAETTRHQQQQQERRREVRARREPLPCERCKVRKRADMQREKGYVNEEAFERWARRPGGCLGFMHMHEQRAPQSPISFAETETEPPPAPR